MKQKYNFFGEWLEFDEGIKKYYPELLIDAKSSQMQEMNQQELARLAKILPVQDSDACD